MRLTHDHDAEGPPCGFMEGSLQRVADGTANPIVRLYALSHAARCGRCERFLDRMRATLDRLRSARDEAPASEADALARLAAGAWREEATASSDPPHSGG